MEITPEANARGTALPGANMELKVNATLKRPGAFVVSPIGSIDTAGHTIFQTRAQ